MQPAEVEHLTATIVAVLDEARALARTEGINDKFRETMRHARELHELLVEHANEIDTAIGQLEALADMPDGKMQ